MRRHSTPHLEGSTSFPRCQLSEHLSIGRTTILSLRSRQDAENMSTQKGHDAHDWVFPSRAEQLEKTRISIKRDGRWCQPVSSVSCGRWSIAEFRWLQLQVQCSGPQLWRPVGCPPLPPLQHLASRTWRCQLGSSITIYSMWSQGWIWMDWLGCLLQFRWPESGPRYLRHLNGPFQPIDLSAEN